MTTLLFVNEWVKHRTFLLQINCFDNIDVYFTYDGPLELYSHLLALMLQCCEASKVMISLSEALLITLGCKIYR